MPYVASFLVYILSGSGNVKVHGMNNYVGSSGMEESAVLGVGLLLGCPEGY